MRESLVHVGTEGFFVLKAWLVTLVLLCREKTTVPILLFQAAMSLGTASFALIYFVTMLLLAIRDSGVPLLHGGGSFPFPGSVLFCILRGIYT